MVKLISSCVLILTTASGIQGFQIPREKTCHWRMRSASRLPRAKVKMSSSEPTPDPSMSPTDVIEAQMSALQRADIGAVYEFASPGNRQFTGPLDRFKELFKVEAYRPLIGCSSWRLVAALPIEESTYRVSVVVVPAGSSAAPFAGLGPLKYSWLLTRQTGTEFKGCWMTDTVNCEGAWQEP